MSTTSIEPHTGTRATDIHRGPHRLGLAVLVIGLVVTGALTTASRVSYLHSEQHLTNLQTQLTASALGIAPEDLESRLGLAVGIAAVATNPVLSFRNAIASSIGSKGPFINATLVLVRGADVRVLAHIGARSVEDVTSKAADSLFEKAAKTDALITTRAVTRHLQRLGFLMSATGSHGTFVAAAGEPLPENHRLSIPASSPDAGLNVAIYFGTKMTPSALIETSAKLPFSGTVSKAVVPFGSGDLTLVISPERPLAGTWSEFLPWAILIVGVVLSVGIALMTERLVRRREYAEVLARENRRLFQEQRSVAETLQHSLLPQSLPHRREVEIAVRYLPGTIGIDIGGDWYDVVDVGEDRIFFTVGDVSGRGLEAASLMSTLRSAIKAFALDGGDPPTVLTKLTQLLDIGRDKRFATALCGLLDLNAGELMLANAGHLEPLLLRNDTREYIQTNLEPPIGVNHEPYSAVHVSLSHGSTLLAFTDGLVERRGENLDEGLARLRRAATPDVSLENLLDEVLTSLVPGGAADDIAVLGLRMR